MPVPMTIIDFCPMFYHPYGRVIPILLDVLGFAKRKVFRRTKWTARPMSYAVGSQDIFAKVLSHTNASVYRLTITLYKANTTIK